jgi:hypothetical protein
VIRRIGSNAAAGSWSIEASPSGGSTVGGASGGAHRARATRFLGLARASARTARGVLQGLPGGHTMKTVDRTRSRRAARLAALSALSAVAALSAPLLAGCSGGQGESVASSEEDLDLAPARFDVVSIDDTKDPSCPWNHVDSDGKPRCIALAEWRGLNYASPHFVVMGSDDHRADIEGAGNHLALYYDTLNDGWGQGETGAQGAADVWSWANEHFSGSPPTWFVLNEISRSGWEGTTADPDGAKYRAYVVDLVAHLANDHHRKVIVCTPYFAPAAPGAGTKQAAQAASWKGIAKNAVIAAEVQMTGDAVTANPARAGQLLDETIAAYAAVGLSTKDHLMIVDNFSNSKAGAGYGREGAALADWEKVIDVRAQAYEARTHELRGYLSYAWAGNEMGSSSGTRVELEQRYAAQKLPNGN